MRPFLLILFLSASSAAFAQEQERKLIDRILKPDTSLQNDAQNKKFKADRTSTDKRAPVGTFYLQKNSKQKNFDGMRDFSAEKFNSQSSFNTGDETQARQLSQKSAAIKGAYHPKSNTMATPPVHDANKSRPGRDYAGNRPFLDEGKSQKSLSRKNAPLTIEQVRELLNKNK